MKQKNKVIFWLNLAIIGLLIVGCTAPATEAPAPTQPPAATQHSPATEAPAATKAPEQPTKPPVVEIEDYSKAERKDTLIFDALSTVETPDMHNPYIPGSNSITGLRQAMMEPFMILNYRTGELDGWLAESFTSNDTLDVWTLKLREGIKWSDGTPMTADDVIFTIDMLKNTSGMLWNSQMNRWVEKMVKVDDLTVEFTLTSPNPRFVLDHFAVKIGATLSPLPKHIWENQDPLTFKNYDPEKGWPVFSGPYKMYSVSQNDFVLIRDDNWWGAATGFQSLPAPKKLVWTASANEEVKVARMASNEVDVLHDITLGSYEALRGRNPKVIVWHEGPPYSWPDPCPRPLVINNAVEPWNDKEMRWMLNYVINRDQVVEIAYENTTTKLDGLFPAYGGLNAYMALIPKSLIDELWTTNTQKAEDILLSKGYTKVGDYWQKDGQRLSLEIPTLQGDSESIRAVDVMVEQFQNFGIDAVNKITEPGTLYSNVETGNYAMSWGSYVCGSVNEPWANMNTLAGTEVAPIGERATGAQGNGNVFRYVNLEYNTLVDQISKLPLGDPQIEKLFVDAMTIFYDELPTIPLFQAKKLLPFNTTYWTNWPTAENDYVVPAHWWQSTLLIILNVKPAP